MLHKAKQVKVREHLDHNEVYEFGAIQIGNKLIAMDNGSILNANADYIEIIQEFPWVNLSDELLGKY